jgi:hypothetical protein
MINKWITGAAKWIVFLAAICTGRIPQSSADVVNGNFNGGNMGFATGYTFVFPDSTGGDYTVDTNPHNFNTAGASFGDHTTGTGLMLIADGSLASNTQVWSELVTVVPNTQYVLSFFSAPWGELSGSLTDPSPATLVASANGVQIGATLNLPSSDGTWTQFTGTFNSGLSTTMPLAIVDSNTTFLGNDFAIDDISVTPVPEPISPALALCSVAYLLLRERHAQTAKHKSIR